MRIKPRSVAQLASVVFIAAAGVVAFRNPTEDSLLILLLLRFGVLLYATFQARFASDASQPWWFGFAVFGWAYIAFGAAAFIDHFAYNVWFDPANPLGNLAALASGMSPGRQSARLASVARFWVTIVLGILGGSLASAIARRKGRRASL
jgi:hypothetical protein